MYPVKTPAVAKSLFRGLVWNKDRSSPSVFLTFDDGPTPEITPFVLNELDRYDAKATFFVIGKNAEAHPFLVQEIIDRGHSIGNHTYSHLNGWKTKDEDYFSDVERCDKLVGSDLFRPPYGRISISQARHLSDGHEVIMWDVLSGDFDTKIDANRCVANVVNNTSNGSIIVFHDSKKAEPRLRGSLPIVIKELSDRGFRLSAL